MYHSACVEVKGQLPRGGSLLPSFCGFGEAHSGHWARTAKAFASGAVSLAIAFYLLIVPTQLSAHLLVHFGGILYHQLAVIC